MSAIVLLLAVLCLFAAAVLWAAVQCKEPVIALMALATLSLSGFNLWQALPIFLPRLQ